MTNTLHRYSEHYAFETPPNPAPVEDDYIVFAMASRGINDDDLVAKYRAFLRLIAARSCEHRRRHQRRDAAPKPGSKPESPLETGSAARPRRSHRGHRWPHNGGSGF